MLYYRTHASRAGELPPELAGWRPPVADVQMTERTDGEHRIVGIVPSFVFAAPMEGWAKVCAGWEVANAGDFSPLWHARVAATMECLPSEIDGVTWLLPRVLDTSGNRAFKVVYGGPDFEPRLTADQQSAMATASEARTCHLAGMMPAMSIQAQWAARLLGCTYCLSPASLGVVGISESVIERTLAVAGGYHAARED